MTDATLLLVPEEKLAVEKGYPVIIDFAALGLPYVNIVLATNRKFLEDQPGAARTFLGCYWEAVKAAKAQPEVAKKALAHWTRTNDSALLEYTYKSWRADYAPQSPLIESKELELLVASAPKGAGKRDVSQFLDMRFLP